MFSMSEWATLGLIDCNKAASRSYGARVFALIEIGIVSEIIARYTVPGLGILFAQKDWHTAES